ncbi:UMTA methyltransferase [Colletotrichum abscissum]|uniref:UMTA methyltransferase n=1 Tax=Colletotrichum abscissum TaxID=1671311 RepID=UPI0027D6FB0A|nr:UMTA methyltransferase [Colletotrichum abscissum]KAK1479414.1 UMTA methyltransferase [Colletotrichum abscissum]
MRPRRVLECGFGAGDWAIDVAQQHPNCEVVAIDICPHIWPDESQTPTNLNLQVDDLNSRYISRRASAAGWTLKCS